MATVTDLTGNQDSLTDETSVSNGTDSNINVYEFGNLLLAGLLSAISGWGLGATEVISGSVSESDVAGGSVTESDKTLSNAETYDFSDFTYEQSGVLYDGVRVSGSVTDESGS